jgi:hypothetical protein
MFDLGICYDRPTIRSRLKGGSLQKYLPHKGGRVLCGCLVPKLNLDAPMEVWPGSTDDIKHWAEVLVRQGEAIPVFLKRSTSRWEYMGMWCPLKPITNRIEIGKRERRSGRRDISMILPMERSEP